MTGLGLVLVFSLITKCFKPVRHTVQTTSRDGISGFNTVLTCKDGGTDEAVVRQKYWQMTVILSTTLNACCENFLPVLTSCRYWDRLDIYSNGGTEQMHCILDQDNVPGIVYTEWKAIPPGYCPIFNRHAKQIDSIPCNRSIGNCPTNLINSYQAVDYAGCFQMPITKPVEEKSTPARNSDQNSIFICTIILLVVTCINVLIGVCTLIIVCLWNKQKQKKPEQECDTLVTGHKMKVINEPTPKRAKTRGSLQKKNYTYRKATLNDVT